MGRINDISCGEVRMPTLSTSNKPSPQQYHPAELQDRIRRRAYELYQQRHRTEGHDLDDWLQAEAELTGTKPQAPLELDQWVAYDGWHCTQK